MTDIVERLRNDAYALPSNGDWIERNGDTIPNNSLSQAADIIEAQRQQLAECQTNETRRAKLLDDAESVIVRQREERIEAIKSAKREAYLELHDMAMHSSNSDWMMSHCRQKAKELET